MQKPPRDYKGRDAKRFIISYTGGKTKTTGFNVNKNKTNKSHEGV